VVVKYRSAAELATEEIRHRIHSGELEAEAKIGIDTLALEMGLSNTPVREALKLLEGEGLVRIAPRNGVYVRRISAVEVAEVYAIKLFLEPLQLRWAMLRGSSDQLQTLVDFGPRLVALARKDRLEEYVEVVEERRRLELTMARSDVLKTISQAIDGRVRLLRYRNLAQPGHMRRSSQDHQAIARAVADRDVERACMLAASAIRSATKSVLKLVGQGDGGAETVAKSLTGPWIEQLVAGAGDAGGIGFTPEPRSLGRSPASSKRAVPAAKSPVLAGTAGPSGFPKS
jgi:DNA-binding GntR family transcriptional regulator